MLQMIDQAHNQMKQQQGLVVGRPVVNNLISTRYEGKPNSLPLQITQQNSSSLADIQLTAVLKQPQQQSGSFSWG